MTLQSLRNDIDRLDRRLVRLLNQRAAIAMQIGRVKRAQGVAVYAPARENEVLARVAGLSRGPLSAGAIQSIYREIMSASLALEGDLRVGVCGAAGGAAAQAARARFGGCVTYRCRRSAGAVLRDVRAGAVHCALLPMADLLRAAASPSGSAVFRAGQLAVCARCDDAGAAFAVVGPGSSQGARGLGLWLGASRPRAGLLPRGWTGRRVAASRRVMWLLEGPGSLDGDAVRAEKRLVPLGSCPAGSRRERAAR